MPETKILIIDDDATSQAALQLILDSEGWKIRVQPLASEILNELAREEWTLLLANVALTGMSGPAFATLRDLAIVQARSDRDPQTRFPSVFRPPRFRAGAEPRSTALPRRTVFPNQRDHLPQVF